MTDEPRSRHGMAGQQLKLGSGACSRHVALGASRLRSKACGRQAPPPEAAPQRPGPGLPNFRA